ncbi:hypothetical protein SEUCBS139899_009014 [Sporothrix eucalyptigena]|uniref:Uncharacterized protein n=1 Tax=Sporothrix eucalyptigena TaxID=1812306 RepID=A0ABP0AM29_9PEZI
MGTCFSRDIDGYNRRTGKPPGRDPYYYNVNTMPPVNGTYNMRMYDDRRDMHPLGHRRRRRGRGRRAGNMAAIAASTGATVAMC